MKEKEYSRRRFISQYTTRCAALMGTMFLLYGCGDDEKPAAKEENTDKPATDRCNDFTGVSEEELDKRKRMAYVDKSQIPDNSCGNCGLYIPWEDQTACGGCLLFKGPVREEGHCIQWVAKTA
ncbi:MAG TPA: hypothetical protein PK339_09400 [Flavitalea sp.]|nr:hypothetical protein [Flavitalea sp.]